VVLSDFIGHYRACGAVLPRLLTAAFVVVDSLRPAPIWQELLQRCPKWLGTACCYEPGEVSLSFQALKLINREYYQPLLI
jgi:hypothetical protein